MNFSTIHNAVQYRITMSKHIYVLPLIFLLYLINHSWGDCNICQSNGAACINQTSYHLCFGSNEPYTNQTFSCTDGLVCTDQPIICFQRSDTPSSCGDTDNCGQCAPNYVFACTSRSTFAFCFGATTPTNVTGSCPDNYFCDASTQQICVNQASDGSIVCHLN